MVLDLVDLGEPVHPRFLQSIAITLGSRPRNSSGNGAATRRPSRFPSCETLESWDERLRVRPTTATGRQTRARPMGLGPSAISFGAARGPLRALQSPARSTRA